MATIYRRKKNGKPYGAWQICYYDGGRCIQRSLKTKDRKTADLYRMEIEVKLAQGQRPFPPDKPLSTAVDEFLQDGEARKAAGTMRTERFRLIRIRDFLLARGRRRVRDVTTGDVEALKAMLFAEGLTAQTVHHYQALARAFCNWARRLGYTFANPCDDAAPVTGIERKLPRCLSGEEIPQVLKMCEGTACYPMVALGIYAGLRLGEIQRLEWADVNMARPELVIRKAKSRKERVIPIAAELMEILGARRRRSEFVCPSPEGKAFRYNADRLFRGIQRQHKINPTFGWHVLRHTFVTELLRRGVPMHVVAELAGHSDITTTRRYAHVIGSDRRDAVEKLTFGSMP